MQTLGRILVWGTAAMLATAPLAAKAAEIWLAPPDSVTQRNTDFQQLFDNPNSWAHAAATTKVFSFTGRYLFTTPPDVVKRELAALRARGIRLDVSIEAMTTDKKVCGDGIEGMVWPGEPPAFAKKLKELGAVVDSFSLDGPLNSGHTYSGKNACRLPVKEAAHRMAVAMRAIAAVYPQAKFNDTEPPTELPIPQWKETLTEWLNAVQAESGIAFSGVTMDVNWNKPWQAQAKATAELLHARGMKVGILINAGGRPGQSAQAWTTDARRNACAVRAAGVPTDYVVVANWQQMAVPNVPDTNPGSLTSLVDWFGAGAPCR